MGVPFEALIPYGIMLAVSPYNTSLTSQWHILSFADVRHYRSRSFEGQAYAERRKEGEAFGGSMGQGQYLNLQSDHSVSSKC
jgi:hypothetical protein